MSEKKITKPKLSQRQKALLSERDKKFDSSATANSCIDDLRAVQEENPLTHISRNFYREHGKYSDATWNQFFGTFLEFRRQAGLELSRKQHEMERNIAKHASIDKVREFYKSEVLPWCDKYEKKSNNKRIKTILAASDFHDIETDPFVLGVFLDTAKRMQPDVICLAGDLFSGTEFSKYYQDPREFKIKERFKFVQEQILAPLRTACPNAQIDFIAGNHCLYILKMMAERTPGIRVVLSDVMDLSLADIFGLPKYKVNFICKLDLATFTQADQNEALKENFKVYYDCFVATHYKSLEYGLSGVSGHTHKPETVVSANIPMKKITWTTMGCMAKTNVEYVGGIDKYMNGFAYFFIDTLTKTVQPNNVLIPGDSVIVEGKYYERKR